VRACPTALRDDVQQALCYVIARHVMLPLPCMCDRHFASVRYGMPVSGMCNRHLLMWPAALADVARCLCTDTRHLSIFLSCTLLQQCPLPHTHATKAPCTSHRQQKLQKQQQKQQDLTLRILDFVILNFAAWLGPFKDLLVTERPLCVQQIVQCDCCRPDVADGTVGDHVLVCSVAVPHRLWRHPHSTPNRGLGWALHMQHCHRLLPSTCCAASSTVGMLACCTTSCSLRSVLAGAQQPGPCSHAVPCPRCGKGHAPPVPENAYLLQTARWGTRSCS
jgi:hypothetical protein